MYSNVEGAVANTISGQVESDIKQARLDRLMKVQKRISQKKLSEKVGSIQTLLPEYSRGKIQAWIKTGHITIDGQTIPSKKHSLLHPVFLDQ